jgi:hypothetical protein
MGQAMSDMDWSIVGLSDAQSRHLDQLALGPDEFTLSHLARIWLGWVREIESGQLWVREEYLSALDIRDDLDDVLPLVPEDVAQAVFRVVDELDRRFRDATVASIPVDDPLRWWRARVPIRNSQRLYLFDKLDDQLCRRPPTELRE